MEIGWGGGGGSSLNQAHSPLLVFSTISFALFVYTKRLLDDIYSIQCVRDRLITMLVTIPLHESVVFLRTIFRLRRAENACWEAHW